MKKLDLMNTPRKPLWPKIVATLALLAVLYVASFGPVVWLCWERRAAIPDFAEPIFAVYIPLAQVVVYVPNVIAEPYLNYLQWWSGSFGTMARMRRSLDSDLR